MIVIIYFYYYLHKYLTNSGLVMICFYYYLRLKYLFDLTLTND